MKLVVKKVLFSVCSILLLPSSLVYADTKSALGNMQITATLNPSCQLNVTNLAFGIADSTSIVNTNLLVVCTNTTSYTIALNSGYGTMTARVMNGNISSNTDKLNYGLYIDSSGTQPFGDGTAGTYTLSGIGNGNQITIPIYGKLPPNQYVTPDRYRDIISIMISY